MKNHQSSWNELLIEKAAVLTGIAESGHDNAKLRELNEWLRRELDLEAKHKGILSEAERLVTERQRQAEPRPVERPHVGTSPATEGEWTFAALEKGERARVARRAYFKRQAERGHTYAKVGRIYYRNGDGVVLGITFSSDNGGTWFLNLKANQFQEAVLLCQSGPRSVTVIHLPKEFLDKYGKQLSADKKEEIKFNFLRNGNKWLLEVPQPTGTVDVTAYVDPQELPCIRLDYE
jgi:hypothetical protein